MYAGHVGATPELLSVYAPTDGGRTDGRRPMLYAFCYGHSQRNKAPVDRIHTVYGRYICCGALVGPCSLEYTKMKIADHYWTDPTASELVQRHRIHSSARQHGRLQRGGSPQRPALRVTSTFHLHPVSPKTPTCLFFE